jgi:hypothetical protein
MEPRLNFALEGFRLLKAQPKLLLFWGLVCLFGYGICALLLVAIVGPHHADILAFNTKPDDVALALVIAGRIFTALAACTPVYLITSTMLVCAICRASLEAGDDRLGYLRFGLRELRVLAVQAATLGLSVVLFWAVAIAWSILGLPVQFTPIGIFIAFLAVAWLRLRLSLNAVQSFATRRIDIFGSFQLTRGRSVALMGGYLLAFGLSMIVSYLSEAAIDGVTLLAFGQQQANVPLNLTSLDAFLTPPRIVILVLWLGLAWPQTTAVIHGAPVAAYRDITGTKP